jgi:hypothetical protein
MNVRTRCPVLIVAVAFAVAGCSAEPTRQAGPPAVAPAAATTPAPGAAVATTPAPGAAAATTPAPGAAAAATAAPASSAAAKVPAGYRLEKRGGKEVYCRSVVVIGSKFPEKMCFTREQIDQIEGNTDSAMGEMQRKIPICGGTGSCPSGT